MSRWAVSGWGTSRLARCARISCCLVGDVTKRPSKCDKAGLWRWAGQPRPGFLRDPGHSESWPSTGLRQAPAFIIKCSYRQ